MTSALKATIFQAFPLHPPPPPCLVSITKLSTLFTYKLYYKPLIKCKCCAIIACHERQLPRPSHTPMAGSNSALCLSFSLLSVSLSGWWNKCRQLIVALCIHFGAFNISSAVVSHFCRLHPPPRTPHHPRILLPTPSAFSFRSRSFVLMINELFYNATAAAAVTCPPWLPPALRGIATALICRVLRQPTQPFISLSSQVHLVCRCFVLAPKSHLVS